MSLFTPEQVVAIEESEAKATALEDAVRAGINLARELLEINTKTLLGGNTDGAAVYADAMTEWESLKEQMVVAFEDLP